MRRILSTLERLATVIAIALAVALVAVEIAERTGIATEIARGVLAKWLPEGRWDLATCRIDMAGPTLELEGVVWTRGGVELARVERINVTLAPIGLGRVRLESARIEGGKLHVGAPLLGAFQNSSTTGDGGARPSALARRVRIELVDVEVLGDIDERSLGVFEAVLDVQDTNELRLVGSLRDSLGTRGNVRGRGRIYEDGEVLIDLETSALPLAPLGVLMPSLKLETRGSAKIVARARGRSDRLDSIVAELDVVGLGTTTSELVRQLDDIAINGRLEWRSGGSPIGTLTGRLGGRGSWAGGPLTFGWRGGASPFGDVFVCVGERVIDDSIRSVVHMAVPGEEQIVDNTFRALAVEGRADIWFGLRVVEADPGPRGVEGYTSDLALVGRARGEVSARIDGWPNDAGELQGFPLRVEGLTGTTVYGHRGDAAMRDRMLTLPTIGRAGAGKLRVEGWLASPLPTYARGSRATDGRARLRFRVVADDLPIDAELVRAIGATGSGVDVEALIEPRAGRVFGTVELEQSPTLEGFVLSVDAQLEGVRGRWSEPYLPFEGADGTFRLRVSSRTGDLGADDGERRRALGFQVVASGSPVGEPNAHIRVAGASRSPDPLAAAVSGSDQMFEWTIDVDGLSTDSPLVAPFVDSIGDVRSQLESAKLRGVVSANYQMTAELFGRDEMDRLRIALTSAVAHFGELAIDSGSVRVAVERRRASGKDREGRSEPWRGAFEADARDSAGAVWSLAGDIAPERATPIVVRAAGVRPKRPEYAGMLGDDVPLSGALDGWAEFDLGDDLAAIATLPMPRRASVQLRGAGLALGSLAVEGLTGTLATSSTRIESDSIHGTLAGSPFELRDVVWYLDPAHSATSPALPLPSDSAGRDVAVRFTARAFAQNLPLDPRELSFRNSAVSTWAADHRWRGRVDLDGLDLVYGTDSLGEPVIRARGNLVPHDLFAYLSFPVRLSSAALRVDDFVFDASGLSGRARLTDAYGEIANQPLARASAEIELTHDELRVRDLVGQLSGGTVSGFGPVDDPRTSVTIVFASQPTFRLGLSAQRVDVGDTVAELFGSGVQSRGLLQGSIELEGTGEDLLTYRAKGQVRVSDAHLWSLPVIRELFATLGLDATATFDLLETKFVLAAGRLRLEETSAHSPIVTLVGGGSVDVDGTLEQHFELHYSLVDRVPFLSKVFYWFQSRLVRIEIGGTIERPRVRLANALRNVFRSGDDTELFLPLPATTPLPPRF